MPPFTSTRRRVLRGAGLLAGASALGLASTGSAMAAKPNFQAGFWGDDRRWGTTALGVLPEPDNKDSLDKLFFIPGQAPLSEAAPGNPAYNGGRWWSQTVAVDDPEGMIDPPITSYTELAGYVADGLVSVSPGEATHPDFFECPLLPYKG